MLDVLLTVVLAAVNLGVAVFVLKNAHKMFNSQPKWLNSLIENTSETALDKINDFIDGKIEQFLLPDESGNNFVDLLAQRFGKGFRMSLMAQKSGEARHHKMIENRVFDALKQNSPELNLGLKALEQFGLGDLATPENLPALLQVAQKYGLFGSFINENKQNRGNNGLRMAGK